MPSPKLDPAAGLGVSRDMVSKWRSRFLAGRLDGLSDEPRLGRPRLIGDDRVEQVITKTLEETPGQDTHWSTWSAFYLDPPDGALVLAVEPRQRDAASDALWCLRPARAAHRRTHRRAPRRFAAPEAVAYDMTAEVIDGPAGAPESGTPA